MHLNPAANLHYCVVQTHEAGRPVLTSVPSGWVSGKFLLWPPKRADETRKDVRSTPAATWIKIPCKVKRRYIPTFNAAKEEIGEMSGVTTDSDIGGPPTSKKARKKTDEQGESSGMDFNSHFQKKIAGTDDTDTNNTRIRSPPNPVIPEVIILEPGSSDPEPSALTIPWPETEFVQAVTRSIDVPNIATSVVNLEQATIDLSFLKQEIFEKIETTKHEIINGVKVLVEELMTKTMAAMKSDVNAKLELMQENAIMKDIKPQLTFHAVSSIEELQELEHNLEDADYARKLMRHMKQIIGTTGDQYNGPNFCYELVDRFFDRKFMTKCSWTGQSRSEEAKYALQTFTRILDLFFSIVKSVNEHFTQKALNEFFKSITRNSKKRSEAKLLRQSAVKRRGRKPQNGRMANDSPSIPQKQTDDGGGDDGDADATINKEYETNEFGKME
ncbi:hypothetical protein RP20_CCG018755 [Aedes albopictus]|nr:hypothetical protein RP20_CCG018755 [Aedes albopictus]